MTTAALSPDDAWKSPAGWAAEGLNGMPKTMQAIALVAQSEWRALGHGKARKRKGRGGGWEYHVSCLPDAAQADWLRRQRAAEAQAVAQHRQAQVARAVETAPETITARRRQIMEARAALVIDIQRREFTLKSASKAIASLLADAENGLLPDLMMKQLDLATDKKRSALPSRSRLFEWRRLYQDGGVKALLPDTRAQEVKQDHPVWLAEMLRFYCRPQKLTLADALKAMAAARPDEFVPSYDQARRALKGLQGTVRWIDAHKGREGPLALKARLAFVRRTLDGVEPTEIYTADGKTFEAYVAHPIHGRPFRPEVTSILDVATRKCVGWSVDLAENSRGTADALRTACANNGIPAIFYTDRGPGFRNKMMDDASLGICARLAITTQHSLPYLSQSRGIIERSHQTIWTPLAKTFPTYCGDDMDREVFQRQHKAIGRDIKEFGHSNALPSWDDFVAAVEAAVAAYNDRTHSGLRVRDGATGRMRKASPNECWASFVQAGFEAIPLEAHEADDLFRPYFKRTCARGEISWNNNKYFHADLQAFDRMEVIVGVDIHDASKVWVRRLEIDDGKIVPGALICVADFYGNAQRYYPQSVTEKAKESRSKGRMRRIDAKRDEIEAETRAPYYIEGRVEQPAPFIDATPVADPVATLSPAAPGAPHETARHWDEDADFALRVLEDPSLLTPGWARLLDDKMRRPTGRDILREAGVDLMDLEDLIRSAA
ncbi:transposase [Paracoccus sp. (in: a-proteobacteria)]|uniref:transposase n=1 Tax=Paracoccus sp. TaxID=267 RepID=UPI0026E0ED23|nr:transposase [Paracoccus sp. (in: a-proteobacteria)]MDO5648359.1 transposase [Paracoccus sp. (in: a-proteobacteria)]